MRGLAILTALLSLAVGSAAAGTTGRTALTVTYWAQGSASTAKTVWTLRCDPAGGTLRRPARACRRLADGGRQLFAPVKSGTICTQIYGGPEVALVSGTLDGRRLWARFQRRNGCEIDRWNRLSPWLLPPGGVT
jgi:Subtilisin inhibitor-like